MKIKMMKLFKLLSLCIIFGQLSCEKDFDENKIQNQIDIKVKEYTFDQINQKPKFNNSYTIVTRGISYKISTSRDNENNPINFSIDSTTIKEITFGSKTTYTMYVVRDIQQTESFENFIVEVDNTTNNIRAFLIEYFPDTEIEHVHEHNSFSFHGTKVIREIEYDSTVFQPYVESYECGYTLMCHYEGEHVAGSNCTQTYLVYGCTLGGSGGSDGGGLGSGGGGGSSGSGSGGNNTNPLGDSLITAPVLTEEYLDEQAQIKREKDFKRNLNWDQSTWFNANTDAQNSIYEYLESQISNSIDETYPQEAKEFAMELVDTSIQLEINMADIWNNDYETFRNQMSISERAIFDTILSNRQMWYMGSAYKALEKSNELFPNTYIPSNSHNGKGDAFRHALWNAYFTGFCGATLAEQLTTAHEENIDPNNPFPQKEIDMDLFNNQKGRLIASYSNINNVTQNVLDYLNSGGLRYLNALNPNPPYYPTFYSTLIPTDQ